MHRDPLVHSKFDCRGLGPGAIRVGLLLGVRLLLILGSCVEVVAGKFFQTVDILCCAVVENMQVVEEALAWDATVSGADHARHGHTQAKLAGPRCDCRGVKLGERVVLLEEEAELIRLLLVG